MSEFIDLNELRNRANVIIANSTSSSSPSEEAILEYTEIIKQYLANGGSR